MAPSLILLGTYLLVIVVLQILGYFVSRAVGHFDPTLSLMTFLILFIGMFGLAWPIAVRLIDRLVPETEHERAQRLAR